MKGKVYGFILIFSACISWSFPAKSQSVDSLCSRIEYSFDELNNEKTFLSPGILNRKGGGIEEAKMIFIKIIKGRLLPAYFVSLRTEVLTPLLTEHGVALTLMNGQRITKPRASVITDIDNFGKIIRRSYVPLTDADVAQLRQSPVKNYKLFNDVDSVEHAENFMLWLNCLTNKK